MTRLEPKPRYIGLLLLSFGAVAASFLWQGHAGFNIGDEGYLWYGVQRVMQGEVPLRDFLSYDPGRYYWCALLMRLWGGDGIISLRVAVAAFQALGLFAALALLARDSGPRNPLWWLLVTATLLVWMYPRHKLFDVAVSIFLVGALAFLLAHPDRRGYLLAGVSVGLAAVFGRNHGVYGLAGSALAIAYLALGRDSGPSLPKACAWWTCGVCLGYIPVLLMFAIVPGFVPAFWRSIRILFEAGTTNLPLPVPWPWRAPFGQVAAPEAATDFLVGLFFIGIVAFGIVGIAWSVVRRIRGHSSPPLVVASAMMSLPYSHFAYSRADVGHLALSVFPLLVGVLALSDMLRPRAMWPIAGALCAASVFVVLPLHPGWRCALPGECVETAVGSSPLAVERGTAADLELLHRLVERYAPDGRTFYAAPFWPGAYAAFGRRAPVWEIYPLSPRGESLQRAEVERLRAARPGFAVILDYALDGREELRFPNSHPIIDRYVRDNFAPVEGYTSNPMYRVYRDARPAR